MAPVSANTNTPAAEDSANMNVPTVEDGLTPMLMPTMPPPCIDPVLLDQMNNPHPHVHKNTLDYTISGTRLQATETPIEHAQVTPLQTSITNIASPSIELTPVAKNTEVLSAAEKRRRTREANKLKRKSENGGPAGEEAKRVQRVIRAPKRADASPEKPKQAENKASGKKK